MSIIKILNKQKYKPTTPTKSSFIHTYQYGQRVTSDTSMEVAAFYRGLFYIASQIAKLPWDIKTFDNKILNTKTVYIKCISYHIQSQPSRGSDHPLADLFNGSQCDKT